MTHYAKKWSEQQLRPKQGDRGAEGREEEKEGW